MEYATEGEHDVEHLKDLGYKDCPTYALIEATTVFITGWPQKVLELSSSS